VTEQKKNTAPKRDLLKILFEAEMITNPDQRIAKMRDFYSKLLKEYHIIPLFFAPNMIFVSDHIDRRQLEYFGNTLKFDKLRKRT